MTGVVKPPYIYIDDERNKRNGLIVFPYEGHFGSSELTGQSKKFRRVYETPQEYRGSLDDASGYPLQKITNLQSLWWFNSRKRNHSFFEIKGACGKSKETYG